MGDREPYCDFEMGVVEERFVTNGTNLRPDVTVHISLLTEEGGTKLRIGAVQPDPNDTDYFVAIGRTEHPGIKGLFVKARDIRFHRDKAGVQVGDTLDFNPDSEHEGIKSKKLWAALGTATVTLAGIVVTRNVLRARKK